MKVGFRYGENVTSGVKDTGAYMDTAPKLKTSKRDKKAPSKIGTLNVCAKVGNKVLVGNKTVASENKDENESKIKATGNTLPTQKVETDTNNNSVKTSPEVKNNIEDTTDKPQSNYVMFSGIITNTSKLDGDEENKIKCIVLTDPINGEYAKINFGSDQAYIVIPTINDHLLSELSIVEVDTLEELQKTIEELRAENEMLAQEIKNLNDKDSEDDSNGNVDNSSDEGDQEVIIDNKGRLRDKSGKFVSAAKVGETENMEFDTSSPLLDHQQESVDETGGENQENVPVGAMPPRTGKRFQNEFYENYNNGNNKGKKGKK